MAPFDQIPGSGPVLCDAGTLISPRFAPVVEDFDPEVESLAFTLDSKDAEGNLVLNDLLDESGVEVFVNGRLVVTLMGCIAADIPDNCLTFEFED